MACRRRNRYQQSRAAQTVGDVAYIANRLTWKGAIAFGVALFVLFYWIIPAALHYYLGTARTGTIKPIIDSVFARRIHWFEWVGIALGLVCAFFAVHHYLADRRLSRAGERSAGFWSRILARWLD